MDSPRTDLVAFRKVVYDMRNAQLDYFAAKRQKMDAYGKLKEAKELEKQVDGLCIMIDIDQHQAKQAGLFDAPQTSLIVKKGLSDPKEVAKYYAQKVSFEWLNNEGTGWTKVDGFVNAQTLRMAELERVREFSPVNEKEGVES